VKRIILIIAAGLIVIGVALAIWRGVIYPRSLRFEQKIERGYLRLANEEALAQAASAPTPENLKKLLRVLVLRGNVGRAQVLSRLYGLSVPSVDTVEAFQRQVLDEVKQKGTIKNHFAAGELKDFKGFPVYGVLKFFVGYQFALLGDWNAARDYFAQAERDGVAPELAPYLKYYFARALIIKGDEPDRKRGSKMLSSLLTPTDTYHLNARILVNQLKLAIQSGEVSRYPRLLERIRRLHNRWEYAKALNDLGAAHMHAHEPEKALPLFAQALLEKSVYGSKKASVGGMWRALLDEGATPESTNASFIPDAIYRLAELIAGTNRIVEATPALEQIADDPTYAEEVRGAALAAVARIGVEAPVPPDYQALITQIERLSPGNEWMQLVHLNYARRLVAEGKSRQAENQYAQAAKMDGPYSDDATIEHYRLLKARGGLNFVLTEMKLLEALTTDTASEHFLEAAEELIPLCLYRQQRERASALVEKVAEVDGALATYWRTFLSGEQEADAANLQPSAQTPQLKRFSYYELACRRTVSRADIVPGSLSAALQPPETPEEFLAGVFATDLALSVADGEDIRDLPAMAAAIAIHNLEIGSLPNVSSWHATKLLESGQLQNQPVLPYVLEVAYPRPYLDTTRAAARRYGVEPALIYAVMKKESNFREDAVSGSGAVGLMQLMPPTAALFEPRLPPELQDAPLNEVGKNIHLGAAYLASLQEALGSDHLVLAAYNAGPGTLKAWREQVGSVSAELFINLIPSAETENFVKKTLKYKKIYEILLSNGVESIVRVE